MRILYVATDQVVPGTLGGSVHVQAVAEGLAALGHDVHVATRRDAGRVDARVHWHALGAPANRPQLRLLRARAVRSLALQVKPDVVIERYHNFGGEGVLAARTVDARVVLEVNAPIVDHEGSRKALVDRALVVQPMKQWRTWQVAHADLIVTPSAAIVPPDVPRSRIVELEWGADTERFGRGCRRLATLDAPGRHDRLRLRRRLSRVARCDPAGRGDSAPARAGAHLVSRGARSVTAPSDPRPSVRPTDRRGSCSREAFRTSGCQPRWPQRTSVSHRSTSRSTRR